MQVEDISSSFFDIVYWKLPYLFVVYLKQLRDPDVAGN